jgi:ABC-type branched-subunit amino acid transport system substrate-binding protein
MALSEAFRRQVERRQGRVVGVLVYSPGAHEFSVEVLSVDKWVDAHGLQAVFIPDFAVGAVALATELRSTRPQLPLLGSSGWHDPAVLGPAAEELEGAVFVDGFFRASQRPATRKFVAAYQREYQMIPQLLDAQAYDAAMLLRRVLEAGARKREHVVPGLRALHTLEGAAGTVVVGPQELQRQLFLLRLTAGTISEIVHEPAVPAGPDPVWRPQIPSAAR